LVLVLSELIEGRPVKVIDTYFRTRVRPLRDRVLSHFLALARF
jgi:hypothetical protein